ncbi:LuxR family transcriptional regulator [Nocardioides sp. KR10-350]|uniref:LuxR family transcriptional regulator n=1 Tax=Nocardioides cheoyonin TaxID=3156615 RepID=UPI0032B344AA
MEALGPEDRALFENEGMALYEAAVESGGIAEDDERITPDGKWKPAFDLLVRLGLLRLDSEGQPLWRPEDPASVQSRIVSPLGAEGARLLDESSQWAHDFASVSQVWRRAPAAAGRGPFTYVHGDQISPFIAGLVAECQDEVLTAQPQTGRDTGADLARALQTDSDLLKRGATMRTLYQHAARRSTVTREYVAAVTELGAEVRTLDEFFNRMLVFDRRIAVIPSPESFDSALAIREPTVVGYLVDVFERSWERARPFTSSDTSVMRDIAAEQRAMTMRMLIEGHSDPSAAKRLGVSPRTYAGYVADLKEEFEAETRFQLGYTIGRLGVTGTDEP